MSGPQPLKQEPETKYDPEEELRRMVEQEKMADEANKNAESDEDDYYKPKKGEIKPGQTIKF